MARLGVQESDLIPNAKLLPVEKDVMQNGMPVKQKIHYLAQITAAEEKTSQKGIGMLKLTLSIDHPATGEVIPVDDYLTYHPNGIFRLNRLVELLKLDKKALDTDMFLGRWVKVIVKQEEYTGNEPDPDTGEFIKFVNNKIDKYLREATAEEVNAQGMVSAPSEAKTPF